MIWTSTTTVATEALVTESDHEGPQLRPLIARHGLIRGLRRRIEDWREYPPHGPIALSKTPSDQMDLEREAQLLG